MALGHWLKDYIGPHSGGSGGGGAEPLIVNIVDGEGEIISSLDRTWQEIHDAFPNVILRKTTSGIGGEHESRSSVYCVNEQGGLEGKTYNIYTLGLSSASIVSYATNDPNGYPKS